MTFSSLNDIIKSTHAIDANGGRLPIGIPGRLQTGMHGRLRRYPHTVSTQLVINDVHTHTKDQILGHAVDDMSRRYTAVPQEPLLKAINTLPIIDAWANAPWMKDPVGLSKTFIKGMGARTDLIRVQKASS